jgi:hypothetical protein
MEENSNAKDAIRRVEAVVTNRDVVTGRVFDTLAEAKRWLAEGKDGTS